MSCPRVVSRRDPRQANCTQAPPRRRYTTSTTNSTGNHSLFAVVQSRWRPKTQQASRRCSMLNARRRRLYRKVRYRTKRVKDARSEAQKEIGEYRNQKEEEFKQFESQHTSGNKKAEEDADKETNQKLDEIKGIGKKTGPKVVEDLLKAVMDVQPQVPERVDQPVA
ncbi:uncharacterized protein RHO25_008429 [Cercospora beticola]|uniref:V-type proton ATPase subunit G n=1 Tax=Cercospora beticola TaxID=122368 RepID=A0ABZ0NW81_CERBT|nr:hypothetical protein RHO25_008429 [Cercospora beticola]